MTVINQQNRPSILDEAADSLLKLINDLFPEPSPDLFTLEDFRYRFRLSGLGAAATQSIERSQRINRRSGKFRRAGLCEFHIGLIYLDKDDYRGARQQFAQARQQWSFVQEPAAETLAYVAEGIAQHLAHHYEAAMACYSKANQTLPRVRFGLPAHYKDKVYDSLAQQVEAYQSLLHGQLWPEKEETNTAVSPAPPEPVTQSVTPTPPQPTPVFTEAPPQPTNGVKQDDAVAAPPIVNYDTETTPIPAHQYLGEQYEWFLINKQPESGFFPLDVQQGGWLLADKQPSLRTGELVLVRGSEDYRGGNGRLITVSPVRTRAASHIYLAWLEHITKNDPSENEPPPETAEAQFHITISPDLEQITIPLEDIVGIVVGFWLPVQIR